MVIFKSKQNKFEGNLKVRLRGKKTTSHEKFEILGSQNCQVNELSVKLNRAIVLLFKIRKYVSPKILRSIYFAIFESHISYCSLVWPQNFRIIQQIVNLQNKALRIINFQPRNFITSPLFKQNYFKISR